jgi:transcriptional repressor NrdR
MKCPFCAHLEDKVIDSRAGKDGEVIRRRRECLKCGRRFTSYERVDYALPVLIKKNGNREPFDRQKVMSGLNKALQKRPIDMETREQVADSIERKLISLDVKEIPSKMIGEELGVQGLQGYKRVHGRTEITPQDTEVAVRYCWVHSTAGLAAICFQDEGICPARCSWTGNPA